MESIETGSVLFLHGRYLVADITYRTAIVENGIV